MKGEVAVQGFECFALNGVSLNGRLLICFDSSWPGADARVELLSCAAQRMKLPALAFDTQQFDYSQLQKWRCGPSDLFYAATPFTCQELERSLFFKNVTSFYSTNSFPNVLNKSTSECNSALLASDVSMPKTIVEGTNDLNLLDRYVEFLGGFPVVLKVKGGSKGLGVIKVDTWMGLTSLADYLVFGEQSFVISQYIENQGTIRSVVLGDDILCHVMRVNPENEFRCSSPNRMAAEEIVQPNPRLDAIAIAARKVVQFEFIGVDIIQDVDGNYYVLEVNFPQDFVSPQKFTGVDIAHAAVSYLHGKAQIKGREQ